LLPLLLFLPLTALRPAPFPLSLGIPIFDGKPDRFVCWRFADCSATVIKVIEKEKKEKKGSY
jgi:hypothetical protein